MWLICLLLSVTSVCLSVALCLLFNGRAPAKKHAFRLFYALFSGVFISTLIAFLPVCGVLFTPLQASGYSTFLLAVFHAMQVFTVGCDYKIVSEAAAFCPAYLATVYQMWAAVLFVVAPIFTFGFVLSLFKNLSAYIRYLCAFFKDVYIFSELNEKSLTLAADIRQNHKKAVIVFTDVFEGCDEASYEAVEKAKTTGAICFKKDVLAVNFHVHARNKALFFFTIGIDETENLNQTLQLIETYRQRQQTRIYVFSTKIESELLLTAVDKGALKVHRVNEVQSLINRLLYERGEILFESAKETTDGTKHISAVVIGMGRHGTEMVKALTWFCQMDGYSLEICAFDKDPLAKERFAATAPELMSPAYNGVVIPGEAQYTITVHAGVDVTTATFAEMIHHIDNTSYVLVALGDDDVNINTAVNLRMLFERMKIHPRLQAIVYNSKQNKALQGIRNYRGQSYDIDFIGDRETSYAEKMIIDSELEEAALRRHMKWGNEEEFWTYEYNYRSSIASAIHLRARIKCGISGADKTTEALTPHERDCIEVLEHRRWNAYMRAEGYIYSGSKDKASRNDLGKMHHDLVDFASLSEEDKRKDSTVGTD